FVSNDCLAALDFKNLPLWNLLKIARFDVTLFEDGDGQWVVPSIWNFSISLRVRGCLKRSDEDRCIFDRKTCIIDDFYKTSFSQFTLYSLNIAFVENIDLMYIRTACDKNERKNPSYG